MTTEFIAQIANIVLNAVLAIGSVAVVAVVVPWVKDSLIPWLMEKRLYSIVVCFVKAVEKLASSGQIEKELKKSHVISLLEAKGVDVDDEVLAMIESAVIDLDIAFTSGMYEFEFEEEFDDEFENEPDCEDDDEVYCTEDCVEVE